MKKNLQTLAILFSVVLNLVFIGLYCDRQTGLFRHQGPPPNQASLLYEQLNLSRAQLDRFGPVRDRFHAFVKAQGRRIKAKQLELIDLLAGEPPDRQAVTAKQQEIQALQRQMQAKVIDHLLEERGIFTPEQRRKFFALLKGRIEQGQPPRPAWLPATNTHSATGKSR